MAENLLPNDKRTEPIEEFLDSVLTPIDRMQGIFNSKLQGADNYSSLSLYAGGTYSKYDQVIYYIDGCVYESLIDSNSDTPNTPSSWVKVADSFIGYNESQYFNGSKVVLEYALNRRFWAAFNQPPATSEIYIDLGIINGFIFYCGDTVYNSSYSLDGIGIDGAPDGFTISLYTMFNIWVPALVYADLGADAEQIIRNFVDKYITAGITYSITTY